MLESFHGAFFSEEGTRARLLNMQGHYEVLFQRSRELLDEYNYNKENYSVRKSCLQQVLIPFF